MSKLGRDMQSRLATLLGPDVLILGGGVNGVAILRELALNHISAVLLDQGDFCGGASGVSTRMAHGGLRYLENREFALVREAVTERNLLLRHAPHMVVPQEFCLPTRNRVKGFFGTCLNFLGLGHRKVQPNALGLRAGLMLYDLLDRHNRVLPRHAGSLSRKGLPQQIDPSFNSFVLYHDGKFLNPEGLVFEMLDEAIAVSPQVAALHHVAFQHHSDGSVSVSRRNGDGKWTLRPRLIVNATGAWLDHTNASLGLSTDYVTAVQGTQIVVRHPALQARIGRRAFYYPDWQGRLVICNPLEHTILMGTTELLAPDPGALTIAQSEIDYLTKSLSSLFSDICITTDNVIAAITGARPLQRTTGDLNAANRGHTIHQDRTAAGQTVLSLTGGKWTTFRPFASQTVDIALSVLQRSRICDTRNRPYAGSPLPGMPQPASERGRTLLARYGAIWPRVQSYCEVRPDQPLVHACDYTRREIAWLIDHRGAERLDDLVLRRTSLMLDGLVTEALLTELAEVIRDCLDLKPGWVEAEVQRCLGMPAIRYDPSQVAQMPVPT